MRRLWTGLLLTLLAGCNAESPDSSSAPRTGGGRAAPVGQYEALTSGTPDEMLLHLDAMQREFTGTLEPSPAQARAATKMFTKAVIETARAILRNKDLLPQQATRATDAIMATLATQLEHDPTAMDAMIEVADEVMQNFPKTQAATTAAFAKANVLHTASDARFGGREQRLKVEVPAVIALGRADPPMPQAVEMLAALAQEAENLGHYADAKALHEVLVEKFPTHEKSQDSPARIRRMEQMGRVIEDFKGKNFQGEEVDLETFRGKVVVLDFWGSWCEPCVRGIPELKLMRKELGEKGFEILGVMSDPIEIGKVELARKKIDWPQIHEEVTDDPASLQHRFGVGFYPTYLVVDRQGRLIGSTNAGYVMEAMVLKELGMEPPNARPPQGEAPVPAAAAGASEPKSG